MSKSFRSLWFPKTAPAGCHPGLWLDKLIGEAPGKGDGDAGELLGEVVRVLAKEQQHFGQLRARWRMSIKGTGASLWTRTTAAPLSLHLARASVFENAGICLHRTYGFAFIPGTGLKGMARAYAEEHWLKAQPQESQAKAWEEIEDVFGWAPNKVRDAQTERDDHPARKRTKRVNDREVVVADCAGAVVFHDAWPTKWPLVEKDILACHHNEYYSAAEEGAVPAPGDWESPNLVNFLAVKAGTEFEFALSMAREGADPKLVEKARQWLDGALTHLGAGAKTNAGYGVFKPLGGDADKYPESEAHRTFEVELELVTPAFLGGSDGNARDFRGSSLRGLLRYWWRVGSTGLKPSELRAREYEIFGSSKVGSRVAISVTPKHRLETLTSGHEFGNGGDPKAYLGYGPIEYDRESRKNRTKRVAFDAGGSVVVRFRCSDEHAESEALRALWYLAAFGGVGSRSRRGWGSCRIVRVSRGFPDNYPTLQDARDLNALKDRARRIESFVRDGAPAPPDLEFTARSNGMQLVISSKSFGSWAEALADVGLKMKKFRSHLGKQHQGQSIGADYHLGKDALHRHDAPGRLPYRAAFGLPHAQFYRSLGGRTASFTAFDEGGRSPIELRRASPLFVRIGRLAGSGFFWQVAWFPSRFLPTEAKLRVVERGGHSAWTSQIHLDHPTPVGTIPGARWNLSALNSFLNFLRTDILPDVPKDEGNGGREGPSQVPPEGPPQGRTTRNDQGTQRGSSRDIGDRLDFTALRSDAQARKK